LGSCSWLEFLLNPVRVDKVFVDLTQATKAFLWLENTAIFLLCGQLISVERNYSKCSAYGLSQKSNVFRVGKELIVQMVSSKPNLYKQILGWSFYSYKLAGFFELLEVLTVSNE